MPVVPTTAHWGAFGAVVEDGVVVATVPHGADPTPSPLVGNVVDSLRHPTRVARPAIRAGWLERGPGPDDGRGWEPFVEVSWDEALSRLAAELDRVRTNHGNEAIFGGSYGWASAGRFHLASSQLHRFLHLIGGCTRSVGTYSNGTSQVILPHVVGSADEVLQGVATWSAIAEHTELVVAFGGIPSKNTSIAYGGITRHVATDGLDAALANGVEVALVSPLRDDIAAGATWYPIVPGTDVAMMLGLAHTLIVDGLVDEDFVRRCSTGYETFAAYVLGTDDGVPKDASWAASLCGVPADELRALARRMASRRTFVTVTWSLQRIDHGEQPVWAGIALAALLGQIGLPGGGFGHGYGSMGDVGAVAPAVRLPNLPMTRNPVRTFIPVARIADLLLQPGEAFAFDGETYTYPDIRLVYWAGGNPFHHHQDLFRLRHAFARPDTVVVHEPYWTALARHADIVLPATVALERNDIGGGRRDSHLIAMHAAVAPYADARDDYAILADLAARLGVGDAYTEGRSVDEWVEHIYERWCSGLADRGVTLPPFAEFWAAGGVELPRTERTAPVFAAFRADPDGRPLRTPSGRIELVSDTIAALGYDDCPGHPTWMPPREDDRWPLVLIANQPATRLHSQLDMGAVSQGAKIAGREPLRMHPLDAAARRIDAGDVVRVFNDRGACLAGVVLTDALRPGVVQLATGAWFDPVDDPELGPLCVHGNPNALTADRPTSTLSQGCAGQQTRVEIERFDRPLPPISVLAPPPMREAR